MELVGIHMERPSCIRYVLSPDVLCGLVLVFPAPVHASCPCNEVHSQLAYYEMVWRMVHTQYLRHELFLHHVFLKY